MGFLGPLLGGLATSLLGGVAGATNARPPSLDPNQQNALSSLLMPGGNLMKTAGAPAGIDPVQQALLYGNNANSLTGANNAVTHALVSRGLGHSGLLGAGLIQNANQSQVNQGNINLGLQQQGIQRQQMSIQDILGLLGVNNTPGQSGPGAFFAGMAPVAAYSIQRALNGRAGGSGGGGGSNFTTPGGFFSGDS